MPFVFVCLFFLFTSTNVTHLILLDVSVEEENTVTVVSKLLRCQFSGGRIEKKFLFKGFVLPFLW